MVWDLLRRKNRYELAEDVIGFKSLNVNFYLIGEPGDGNPWTIIDAGITGSGKKIIKEAAKLFGKDNPPQALLLTHGHFDHVGGVPELLKKWPDIKIYAHPLEIPYLTGDLNFPPPENVSGSAAMAYLLQLYSGKTLNFSNHIMPLPESWVPSLEGWRYIHTPGVSPGHISFFRPKDKVLIAGDIITSKQKLSIPPIALSEDPEMQGPPAHYNINKSKVCSSLKRLQSLNPTIAGMGQGRPVSEDSLRSGLDTLVKVFEKEAMKEDDLYKTTELSGAHTSNNGHTFRTVGRIASVFSLLAVGAGLGYYFAKKR